MGGSGGGRDGHRGGDCGRRCGERRSRAVAAVPHRRAAADRGCPGEGARSADRDRSGDLRPWPAVAARGLAAAERHFGPGHREPVGHHLVPGLTAHQGGAAGPGRRDRRAARRPHPVGVEQQVADRDPVRTPGPLHRPSRSGRHRPAVRHRPGGRQQPDSRHPAGRGGAGAQGRRPVDSRQRAAQCLRGRDPGLPAVAGAAEQQVARRQHPDRDRRQPPHPAPGRGLYPRIVGAGLQHRLHRTDFRHSGGIQLHLHPAARRDSEAADGAEQRAVRPEPGRAEPGGPWRP